MDLLSGVKKMLCVVLNVMKMMTLGGTKKKRHGSVRQFASSPKPISPIYYYACISPRFAPSPMMPFMMPLRFSPTRRRSFLVPRPRITGACCILRAPPSPAPSPTSPRFLLLLLCLHRNRWTDDDASLTLHALHHRTHLELAVRPIVSRARRVLDR